MAARTAWLRALVGAAFLAAACTPTSGPSTSAPATESSATAIGNLPPGCEPIDLRSPAWEAVDLNGTWIRSEEGDALPATWWMVSQGDCIWGTGIVDGYTDDGFLPRADSVQGLQGRVGNDFVIDSTIVLLGPHPDFVVPQYVAKARLLIEFDQAGEIILREIRIAGVQGPRCSDPVIFCPAPLVLRPSSEAGN